MSTDRVNYIASLISGIKPEDIVVGMAKLFLRRELHVHAESSQLTIVREDEGAYYIGAKNAAGRHSLNGIEVRVAKDGSTVERV